MHSLLAVTAVCVHCLTGDVQMLTPKRLGHGRWAIVNVAQGQTRLAASVADARRCRRAIKDWAK